MLVIDAGLKFPSDDMYGVDFLLPEIGYLLEHQARLKGIILTHAHEDHVGGLTSLLEQLESPPNSSFSMASAFAATWNRCAARC